MRYLLSIAFCFILWNSHGQQLTIEEWKEQAKINKALNPKYGHQAKTDSEKKNDADFVAKILNLPQFNSNRTAASDHLIDLGFNYLYKGDLKTAMYRFNQAYLLDSANTNIYWGYGAVYFNLGDFAKAHDQYKEGLALNPENTNLLTDFATWFMAKHYGIHNLDEEEGDSAALDIAIKYLKQSYQIDPTNEHTVYKLSTCYLLSSDCDNAWRYYLECKSLGGKPITEAFTRDLTKACGEKKNN